MNNYIYGFQSPFYLKKGGIILGKINHDYDEIIRRNNMDKNWKCFKISERSLYGLCTIKIYPRPFYSLIRKYYPGLRDKEKFRMTSFVYRSSGGVLMRRGYVPASYKPEFIKIVDEEIISMIVSCSNYELKIKSNKNVRKYMVSMPDLNEQTTDSRSYDITYIKHNIFERDRDVIRMVNGFYNFLTLPSEYNEFLKYVLCIGMDICHQLVNGVSCLVEDTKNWTVSHFFSALVKILIDKNSCTVEGYLSIVSLDWVNYEYCFSDYSELKENGKKLTFSYRLFNLCMQYLLYAYPNKFQFNLMFLDRVEKELYANDLIKTHRSVTICTLDKLYFESFEYIDHTSVPQRTIYQDVSTKNGFTEPMRSVPTIWENIFDEKTYKSFWKSYVNDRELSISFDLLHV